MGRIRISAAGLARIELDGKFLVSLNRKFLGAGRRVYTPFGGSLKFYRPARDFLRGLGDEFEKDRDIRLKIPEDKITYFEEWFFKRTGREISPYRELREELVDEEKIFKRMSRKVVDLKYAFTAVEVNTPTQRPGHEGEPTNRYLEIYNARFNQRYEQMIRTALIKPDTHLALITRQEIILGETTEGTEIGTNCGALIPILRTHH